MNKTWFQVWDCGYFSASPRRIPPQNRYITRSKSQSVIVGLSTRGRCFSQYYIGYYRTIKTSITDLERSLISQRQSNNDKSSIAIHELLLGVCQHWIIIFHTLNGTSPEFMCTNLPDSFTPQTTCSWTFYAGLLGWSLFFTSQATSKEQHPTYKLDSEKQTLCSQFKTHLQTYLFWKQ